MTKPSTLGEAIRLFRTEKRMTLHALAAKTGTSATFMSDLEHNRLDIDDDTLQRIANALGVDVAEFDSVRNQLLTTDLKDWLKDNPDMLALLKDIKAARDSASGLRFVPRKIKAQ